MSGQGLFHAPGVPLQLLLELALHLELLLVLALELVQALFELLVGGALAVPQLLLEGLALVGQAAGGALRLGQLLLDPLFQDLAVVVDQPAPGIGLLLFGLALAFLALFGLLLATLLEAAQGARLLVLHVVIVAKDGPADESDGGNSAADDKG
jgi:hypothetical protein